MKLYNKEKLKFVDGVLTTKKGKIAMPSKTIVEQANQLETMLQQTMYLDRQPDPQPAPTLDGFNRVHSYQAPIVDCRTPLLDEKAELSLALMEEMDKKEHAEKFQEVLDHFAPLVEWAHKDSFAACEHECLISFDTPTLGNPLTWTEESIVKHIAHSCGFYESE